MEREDMKFNVKYIAFEVSVMGKALYEALYSL